MKCIKNLVVVSFEFISMKQSGARGFFLSRLKVGINGIR